MKIPLHWAITVSPGPLLAIDREAREIICLVASVCRPSAVRPSSVCLKNIIECSSKGAFKMVGRSKWLLFRQVAPSRSITLLIVQMLSVNLLSALMTYKGHVKNNEAKV